MKVSGWLRLSTPLFWDKRASDVHWMGGWVGFRTGVNVVANRLFIYAFIICLTALSVAQIRAMVSE